jgi:diguanylate cyclase (GGDEF)-like protein
MSERQIPDVVTSASRCASLLGWRVTRRTERIPIYTDIVQAASACVRAEIAALAVHDRREDALRIVATRGYLRSIVEHLRVSPGEGLLGLVFSSGRPLVTGPGTPPDLLRRRRYRTNASILLPLKSTGSVLGVLAVADPFAREQFNRRDLRALLRIAPIAALALERERLRDEVSVAARAATVDPVTGLANRHALDARLHLEIERARRLNHPLAVILIDLDDFKRVNDTLGHSEGDRLLRGVADLLRENVRIFDVCARYGGEEFAIMMPDASETVAVQVAERVRRAVEAAFPERPAPLRMTLSAGVAILRPDDTAERVLDRADFALLDAKAAGKNTVRLATE